MRLVQLTVTAENLESVTELLDVDEQPYTVTEETSGREENRVLTVLTEIDEVEPLVDSIREIGVPPSDFAIVSDTDMILSQSEAETDEEPASTKETGLLASNRISRDELQAQAAEMAALTPNYVFFTVVSALVAVGGLLTDSPAVVVGSMVIAPLLGPAVGASVGSIVNDEKLFRDSLLAQVVGLVLAVGSGTAVALLLKFTIMPTVDLESLNQIASRVNPGALSLLVALGSGAAGAFSISAGESAALVGVMIAAALIPPAAAIGLGIAYWDPILVISVSVLLLVNMVSINLAGLAVLWLRGYRPSYWAEERTAKRKTLKRVGILIVAMLILSSFLAVTTADLNRNAQFDAAVDEITAESSVQVLSVQTEYQTKLFSREPETVTVRAVTRSDRLAAQFRERIKERTGIGVAVIVIRENAETDTPSS